MAAARIRPEVLPRIVQQSFVVGNREVESWNGRTGGTATLTVMVYPAGGIRVVSIVASESGGRPYIHNVFPAAVGEREYTVVVNEVIPSSFGTEATVSASLGQAGIEFFDPYYALTEQDYVPCAEVRVALAGLVYRASVPKAGRTVSHSETGSISLDGAATLIAFDPEARRNVPGDGYRLSYILAPSSRSNADFNFHGPDRYRSLLSGTELRGEGKLEAAGDLEGSVWLQGTTYDGAGS